MHNNYKLPWFFLAILFIFVTKIGTSSAGNFINEEEGFTVLMHAIKKGDLKEAERLLNSGESVNYEVAYGYTPLAVAGMYEHRDMVALLIERGAHINEQDGQSWALKKSFLNAEITRTLLEHGANPNTSKTQNQVGGSVLARVAHLSIYGFDKYSPIVEMLLRYGTDPDDAIKYFDGEYEKSGHAYTADLVKEHFRVYRLLENGRKYKVRVDNEKYKFDNLVDLFFKDKFIQINKEGEILNGYLQKLSKNEIMLLRNAIFARKNYLFDTESLRNYFITRYPSYKPKVRNVSLSYIESRNIQFLKKYENRKKYE